MVESGRFDPEHVNMCGQRYHLPISGQSIKKTSKTISYGEITLLAYLYIYPLI